jgi:CheY-like chemotaxis protein
MATTAPKTGSLADLKIMIVEDQAEVRAMLRNMLVEIGINQIFDAPDGRQALTFIDSAPDLINTIICDWNMPAMNGIDLLRQVRSVYPDFPFLMLTGRADMNSVIEAKSCGVTAYMAKPFSPAQLEAKLRVIRQKMV